MADLGLAAGIVGVIFALAANFLPERSQPWALFLASALLLLGILRVSWTTKLRLWSPGLAAKLKNLEQRFPALEGWRRAFSRWMNRFWFFVWVATIVVVAFPLERFHVFHTVYVSTDALEPTFAGSSVRLSVRGFSPEHPKGLAVNLVSKNAAESVEATNEGLVDQQLRIGIPADLAPGDYNVTVTGPLSLPFWPFRNSATATLRILGNPRITAASPLAGFPAFGGPGSSVVIWGDDLDIHAQTVGAEVYFGTARAATRAGEAQECDSQGAGRISPCIVAFVPGEAPEGRTVKLAVKTGRPSASLNSNAVDFYVLGPPSIDQTDLRAFPGSAIEIRGMNFYPAVDSTLMNVTIGGEPAAIEHAALDVISVRIPTDAKPGNAEVKIWTHARGASTVSGSIRILGPPVIDEVRPGEAHPGETIEVIGRNFDTDHAERNSVILGGAVARVVGAERSNEQTIVKVIVPALAESDTVVLKTPAGSVDKPRSFQVEPIIDNISPPRTYIANTISVEGRGIFRHAAGQTANGKPMKPKGFNQTGTGQIIRFEVPQDAETGPITIEQGSGVRATSTHDLTIDRLDEISHMPLASPSIPVRTPRGTVELTAQCDKGLVVRGPLPGLLQQLPAGRCPVDVAVDAAAGLAYTANAKETRDHGITEFDIHDAVHPKFIQFIDSGGSNPTRVRLLHSGEIVAANSDGIFSGNAKDGLKQAGISGRVLKLIGDSVERQFVVAVMEDGRIAILSQKGPPQLGDLKGKPVAATLSGRKIYVVNYGSDNVAVVDPKNPKNISYINLSLGARPFDLASDPVRRELWVTETGLKQVAVVDTGINKAVEIMAGVEVPTFIALSPDACVAVVYDAQRGDFAKISPQRRSVFDSVQHLPDPPQQVLGLRVDARLEAFLLLGDDTMVGPYRASCPPP
jgi:YVTN family beta-propeller protein